MSEQKPKNLMVDCKDILNKSKPPLDPFCGIASTLLQKSDAELDHFISEAFVLLAHQLSSQKLADVRHLA